MAQRRTSPTPGGSRRPGQRGQTSRGRVAAPFQGAPDLPEPSSGAPRRTTDRVGAPGVQPGGRPPGRSRFTGRAAVLGLVLAVLAVSYASSMRAYVDQRERITGLQTQITETEAEIAALEREKRRWDDPAYVKAQARATLGYLMPGETGFQVLDAEGNPLEAGADLHDPAEVLPTEPVPWWEDVWGSVELAGNPPEKRTAPEKIDGVAENKKNDREND